MSDVHSVAALLIEHSRRNIEGCRCGWSDLGKSHARHVAEVLDETGLLVTSEEADFIAYGVERGWLEEKVHPEFHYPGGVEPAVRQYVTKGEELPLAPPPTPEEIEVLKRRLAGLEP